MSKAEDKRAKKATGANQSEVSKDTKNDNPVGKGRDLKNENMFRMWEARPTRVPSVPKSKVVAAKIEIQDSIDWKVVSICSVTVAILAIAAHISGLFGTFVLNDMLVLGPLRAGANSEMFWTALVARGLQTPLSGLWTNVGLALDTRASSLIWFHLVNLMLHALTSVYIFFLLYQLGRYWKEEKRTALKPEYLAFATAAIFASHPLASEIVSYIPARADVLVGANYFIAIICFFTAFLARGPVLMLMAYLAMFAAIAMAVFSGPGAISIPFALLTVAALLKPADMEWSEWAKFRIPDLSIIVAMIAGFGWLLKMGVPTALGNGIGLPSLPFATYVASEFKAFATYYLRGFAVPGGLSIEPPFVVSNGFGDPLTLLGIACVGVFAFLAYKFREIPALCLGLILTLIGLIPEFFIPQPEIISDARFYISLSGLCILVGFGFARIAATNLKQAALIGGILIVGLIGLSNWRALAWSNEVKVWESVIQTNAGSARAHAKLALARLSEVKIPDAKKEIDEALKLDAASPMAYYAQGKLRVVEKNYADAVKNFEKAISLGIETNTSPIFVAQCQSDLALAMVRNKDYSRVSEMIAKAQPVLGEDSQLDFIDGLNKLHEKQYVPAIVALQKVYMRDPRNYDLMEPIAEAYLGSKMPQLIPQGYQAAEQAVRLTLSKKSILLLARANYELNKIDESSKLIDKAQAIGGVDAESLYLRSLIAKATKKDAEATVLKSKALLLDPDVEANVPVVDPSQIKSYLDKTNAAQKVTPGRLPAILTAPGAAPKIVPTTPTVAPISEPASQPAPAPETKTSAPTTTPTTTPTTVPTK